MIKDGKVFEILITLIDDTLGMINKLIYWVEALVMGRDSCSKGCEFKFQHHILDGHFSQLFVVKIVMLFEKTKINEKEDGDCPL